MDYYGFWSLVPPLIAIFLAIKTKEVYSSLLLGIWLGWIIIKGGNPLSGTMACVQSLVDVFKDPGNTRTIMFAALVGAIILFIQKSGGVQGFIVYINSKLKKYQDQDSRKSRIIVEFLAWCIGVLVFVESSISVLTVGSLFRPLFDKLKIPREKLAYIADSSSAPASILIPFNAWGAFIMGLLAAQGFSNPFRTLFSSAAYNFYPMLALILVLIFIFTGKDYGPMAKAEKRMKDSGALMNEGSRPMVSEELTEVAVKDGIPIRTYNMIIPIAVMVLMMPLMLGFTGWEAAVIARPDASFFNTFFYAIGQGSGSTSVLIAVISSILCSFILYRAQRIFTFKESINITMKGISGLMPLALLMMLAFAISALCKELGTGAYVADVAQTWLSPDLVPFLVFVVSCFIAFSTGTSWGTFAIMIAIAVPMAREMDANVHLAIASALGGGVFGDHCSPISDTTILSSMASATDHIDHVRTQFPYAIIAGGLTAIAYLLIGFLT